MINIIILYYYKQCQMECFVLLTHLFVFINTMHLRLHYMLSYGL